VGGDRFGVPGVQLDVVPIGLGGFGRDGVDLGLGRLGAAERVGVRSRKPLDLLRGAAGPGARGTHLAGELGQPSRRSAIAFAAVRSAPSAAASCRSSSCRRSTASARRIWSSVSASRSSSSCSRTRRPRPRAAPGRARTLVVGRGGEVAQPLAGQLLGRAEAFLQGGELVPGVLRGGEQRRVLGVLGLEVGEPALHLAVLVLDLLAAVRHRRLVGDLLVQRGPQRVQVVGEQPQPGVAQVGLDAGGAAGHLGLPCRAA
jgi:hypothetical protein